MKAEPVALRELLFPRREICTRQELYFRSDGKTEYLEAEGCLAIDGSAAFDSYFNTLPVVKYRQYCCLSSLFLTLRASGSFVVRVFGVKPGNGGEICIFHRDFSESEKKELKIDLSTCIDSDLTNLYFTLNGRGRLFGGEYSAVGERLSKVNIAVVICTFRREKFLMHNYEQLTAYLRSSGAFDEKSLHVYIVDNGRTLPKEEIENEYVSLFPNANTGGSGGFTRGYYEAVHSGREHTHILFMDDDIVLDCEMLRRVASLLMLRREELEGLAVGGTMICLSDRITQHEAGALWDGKRLASLGNGADLTDREEVFKISSFPAPDYNAWWFFCFPADWQEKHGYPLPFFIKEDDIEYSLRCADEIAVMSGIAVWHDDFAGKYDGFQEYYIKRNELILTSVSGGKPYALFQVRKLILSVMKQTVFQRYFLADIIFRAYNDYLKGWKHFLKTDTEAFNNELMKSCLPLMDDAQLYEKYGVWFDAEKYESALNEPEHLKKQALSLNGYLLPSFCCHHDKDGFSVAPLAGCRIVNFYKHKRVLHYDIERKKGFVTKQSRLKLLKNILRLIFCSIKFLILYPFVRRGYKRHLLSENKDQRFLPERHL